MTKKPHAEYKSFKLKNAFAMLLALVITMFALLSFVACNKEESNFVALKKGNRPSYASILSESDMDAIDGAMSDAATEEQKKAAVMALYNAANRSRQQTKISLMLQNSNAGIALGDVIMHGFNLKNGDKWYYQLAAQVSTGNVAMDKFMASFAGLLKVAYANEDGEYWYSVVKGAESECNCNFATFPYATFILTKQPELFGEEEFKEELHYLESMHEINNMKFCAEILADGAEISYNSAEKFYTVKFSVDMNADRQLLEEWFALPKEDMAVGGQTLVGYKKYEAVLEVWDNGYAKSFRSYSEREAAMALASGKPTDEFEYIWNESEIMSLLKEDHTVKVHEQLNSLDDYLEYYANPQLFKAKLGALEIAGIVIAAIIVLIVIIVVVVEVLVKKGRLPRLAKKRILSKAKHLANRQKRIDRKNAKKGKGQEADATSDNEDAK